MTDHEKKISKFIPKAEVEATNKVSSTGLVTEQRMGANKEKYTFCYWTLFFHQAMNRLTKEAGLRNI